MGSGIKIKSFKSFEVSEDFFDDYLKSDKKEKSNNTISIINESGYKEILKEADPVRKQRAKNLTTYYSGISSTKGWLIFKTTSQYIKGKFYIQYIALSDIKYVKYFKEFSKEDIVRLLLSGDIKVYCNCPDFRYAGYKFMSYNMGYGIFKETRFPKIRNPKLHGSICKHLILCLSVLPLCWKVIAKDIKNSKFFKNKYEEDDTNVSNKRKKSSSVPMPNRGRRVKGTS